MELETLRCAVAAASDPTIGVNVQLEALTLEPGDAPPPRVTIYNAVEHSWLARGVFTLKDIDIALPALAIFVATPTDLDPEVETIVRDAEFTVGFAHLDHQSVSQIGAYNALQTNRAILRMLRRWMANDQSSTLRTRNGIIIRAITRLQQPPTAVVKDDVFIGAETQATLKVRETSP